MMKVPTLIAIFAILKEHMAIQIAWNRTSPIDAAINAGMDDIVHIPNNDFRALFMFPDTKWCGPGNSADNEDDLGENKETDKCCRTHDHCDDTIGGFQTKHNLFNDAFYTRMNCRCDKEFYHCLKADNSQPSQIVGFVYFTLLGTKCFRIRYPLICTEFIYYPLWKQCIKVGYGKKTYQWFDVPYF